AYIDEDFVNDNLDEPHMKRKITILSQYPEIKRLYGHDTITVDITIVGVLVQNRIVGLIANIALLIPISMSFRRHHLKHHAFQGVEEIDPELPSEWEKNIHPVAARYIQEHYTFEDGQETYSCYGGLNKIFMNIGYHTEHHDFTN
ncbi:8118_t:CDS:2, partial [Racocetra fulgida]